MEHPNHKKPAVATGILGMLISLGMDIMFFSSLVSAYLITRSSETEWPPWGQPHLPVVETGIATVILLVSLWTVFQAHQNCSLKNVKRARQMLQISIGIGGLFILFQGYEWLSLTLAGLALTSSSYAGTFYLITGIHALHLSGGVIAMTHLYFKWGQPSFEITGRELVVPQMWWFFVVGIWIPLYGILYVY